MAAEGPSANSVRIDYGEMEPLIRELIVQISSAAALPARYPLRWLAIKLMEGDDEVRNLIRRHQSSAQADGVLGLGEKLRSILRLVTTRCPRFTSPTGAI